MMLIPVLLAGGEGRRLWPLSTPERPKQFLPLKHGETLLAHAARRALAVALASHIVTVTSARHALLTAETLSQIDGQLRRHMITEPCPRNTAAALTIAALYVKEQFDDAIMWALPTDHYMPNTAALQAAVQRAMPHAQEGHIITFGILPERPDTQYGYIRYEHSSRAAHKVVQFIEKPEAEVATALLAQGNCVWNSGMFLCRASILLEAVEAYAASIYTGCRKAYRTLSEKDYRAIPSLPIDRAVMEHAQNLLMMPLAAQWSDIGSFEALRDHMGEEVL